jgi:hypothetical protein
MTKIERYKELDRIADKVIVNLRQAQGLNATGHKDINNDKHSFNFYDRSVWDSDIPIWFHASYGYYGSSSGYTACSPELKPYLIKALNHFKGDIVNYIMEEVKRDKYNALIECKEEAERILDEIKDITVNKAE